MPNIRIWTMSPCDQMVDMIIKIQFNSKSFHFLMCLPTFILEQLDGLYFFFFAVRNQAWVSIHRSRCSPLRYPTPSAKITSALTDLFLSDVRWGGASGRPFTRARHHRRTSRGPLTFQWFIWRQYPFLRRYAHSRTSVGPTAGVSCIRVLWLY